LGSEAGSNNLRSGVAPQGFGIGGGYPYAFQQPEEAHACRLIGRILGIDS